jgi:hypothetical protein
VLLEDVVVLGLVDVVIDLDDVLLLLLDQVLQLLQVRLVDVAETIGLEFAEGFIAQADCGFVDFLALCRIIRKLFLEDLFVLLQCSVESSSSLILGNLLPSRLDIWNSFGIESLHVALDHGGDGRAREHFPFISFGAGISQDIFAEILDALDKFSPQSVIGDVVEALKFALISDWSDEGDTLPVLEIVQDRFLDLPCIVVPFTIALLREAIL